MAEFPEFEPRYIETEEAIRERFDMVVSIETDKRMGSHYYNATEPSVREFAMLWDILNDAIAASSYLFANDIYLDYHAAGYGLIRNIATKATGSVQFSGTSGTYIPSGTRVTTESANESETPIRFLTTTDGTIGIGGTISITAEAESEGVSGNTASGTITQMEDSISGITSVNNIMSFGGGADKESDESLRERISLEIAAPQGAGNVSDYIRWSKSYPGIGAVTVVPTWDGPNTVKVVALDTENNQLTQATLDGLQEMLSGPPLIPDPATAPTINAGAAGALTGAFEYGITFFTEAGETKMSPIAGPLTVSAKRIDLTGIPISPVDLGTNGGRKIYRSDAVTNTFRHVWTLTNNTATVYTDNDADISGENAAPRVNNTTDFSQALVPVGAIVTVDTPNVIPVVVDGHVTYEPGYSEDGAAGTLAIGSQIEDSIRDYVNSLEPGDHVVFNHTEAQFFKVTGVYDVTGVAINGNSSDLIIATDEVADLANVFLT